MPILVSCPKAERTVPRSRVSSDLAHKVSSYAAIALAHAQAASALDAVVLSDGIALRSKVIASSYRDDPCKSETGRFKGSKMRPAISSGY